MSQLITPCASNINLADGCFFRNSKVRHPLKFSDRRRIGN